MSRTTRKSPRSGAVFMLLAIGALGLGALGAYVQYTPANKVPEGIRRVEEDRTAAAPKVQTSSRNQRSRMQTVLVPTLSGEDVKLIEREVPASEAKRAVVGRTLDLFGMDEDGVVSVNVAGGVARINLAPGTLRGMGSAEGSSLLRAFQMAMGQFEDIDLLRFSVDGQDLETLDGHTEVIDGVQVIRPDAKPGETPNRP